MNKSLFDENFKYTKIADEIDYKFTLILRPIFEEYMELGYSPKEISHILLQVVFDQEMESIIMNDVKMKK